MTDRVVTLRACLHNHSGFINDRLASFVGREQELADIRQQIAALQPNGGYVIITGQAGQGKSSVLAKLVDDYGRDHVAHHFIPCIPSLDHQVDLLQNLMAQLCLKHDLSALYVAPDSRPVLRAYLSQVLNEIARTGAQEVIFIDGLDQLEEKANGEQDFSFLPVNPPAGMVLVLGTRPNDTLKSLELLKEQQEYRLPNLSRSDFGLILHHRDVALAPALVDRFYQVVEANALALDLVARELALHDMFDAAAMIDYIAANPDQIFSLVIKRLKRDAQQWQSVLRPLLGMLLAAQHPLSQQALQVLITAPAASVREGVERLGGLVQHDGQGCYSFSHGKLYDFLREDIAQPEKLYVFTLDEEQGYHAQFARWCDRDATLGGIWEDTLDPAEQERRMYSRKHYITHLARAGVYEQLWQVLDVGEYGTAKLRHDPSTRSYVLDLDRARDAVIVAGDGAVAAGIALLPRLWKYSLWRCSLNTCTDALPDNIFPLMAQLGHEQEALRLAELLSEPKCKVDILITLGQHVSSIEDQQQLLARASVVIADIADRLGYNNREVRDKARIKLMQVYAESRMDTLACATAQMLENYLDRREALIKVARIQATRGDMIEVETTIRGIMPEEDRVAVLVAVAQVQVSQGDVAGAQGSLQVARTIANLIEYDEERGDALVMVAETQLEHGDMVAARTTAALIDDAECRATTLLEVAQRLAAVSDLEGAQGNLQAARAAADLIDYAEGRVSALVAVAQVQASQGDIAGAQGSLQAAARTTAELIEHPSWRVHVLMEVLHAQVGVGDLGGAQASLETVRTTADLIDYAEGQASVLVDMAQGQVALGDLGGAQESLQAARAAADLIVMEQRRADVLLEVAQEQAALGDLGGAQESLQAARAAADLIDYEGVRIPFLVKVIQAQVEQGDVDGAWATAELIKSFWYRVSALSQAVQAQVEQGDVDGARIVTELIEDSRRRASDLSKIAQAQAVQEDIAGAHATVELIEDFQERVSTLCEIAQTQVAQGDSAGAQVTIRDITVSESLFRAEVLAKIARTQLALGDFEAAYATMVAMEEGREQIALLIDIAIAEAKRGDSAAAQANLQVIRTRLMTLNNRWWIEHVSRLINPAEVLGVIAQAQATQGDNAGALITAKMITDGQTRVQVLVAIAQAAAGQGEGGVAKTSLAEAQVVAGTIIDESYRAKALAKIATVQASQDDRAGAQASLQAAQITADGIGHASLRSSMLVDIVRAQIEQGDLHAARVSVEKIEDAVQRVEMLVEIAQAHTVQGEQSTAIASLYSAQKAASLIEDTQSRAAVLAKVAHILAINGETDQLLALVQQEWRIATTREYLLRLMPLVTPLFANNAEIAPAIVQSFAWVDAMLTY